MATVTNADGSQRDPDIDRLIAQQVRIVEAVGKAYLQALDDQTYGYVKDFAVANGVAVDKLASLHRIGAYDAAGNPKW